MVTQTRGPVELLAISAGRSMLPRKSRVNRRGDRTANRHR
jgi:hypothetical protein